MGAKDSLCVIVVVRALTTERRQMRCIALWCVIRANEEPAL